MKLQYETNIKIKYAQILELQVTTKQFKDNPNIKDFKKDVVELKTLIAQIQVVFF